MAAVQVETADGPAATSIFGGRRWILPFVVAAGASTLILFHFHDRSWWPPDEGAYAHVAERILAGEVLNLTIQDIHAGYINFANALAFAIFGDSLVSLRYPLAAMGLIQAGVMFALFACRGAVAAVVASIALTALSFIQFPNPTAHWYSLFLTVLAMACLAGWPRGSRWRLFFLGFIVGTLFLFRQLSGVIIAMAVVSYVTCEAARDACDTYRGRGMAGRALALVMAAGLGGYLYARANGFAFVVIGIWPLAVLAWTVWSIRAPDRDMGRIVLCLAAGAAAAAAPLLLYHGLNGSLSSWVDDTVLTAFGLTELDFISRARYGNLLLRGLFGIAAGGSPAGVVNGVFWAVLVVLPMALGLTLLRALMRLGPNAAAFHPVPYLATFYAVVSVHFQIPIYLMYASATTLAGVLWLAVSMPGRWRAPTLALTVFLAAVGLAFHAGQSPSRGIAAIIAGTRVQPVPCDGLDRCGLKVRPDSLAEYRHIVDLVERHSRPGDAVLAIPVNPEIYYLARRRNPLRFFNTALGLKDEQALLDTLRVLERDPPKLVF